MSNYKEPLKFKQPQRCKGCYWGSWNGTKQFCSRLQCVKDAAETDGDGLAPQALKQA